MFAALFGFTFLEGLSDPFQTLVCLCLAPVDIAKHSALNPSSLLDGTLPFHSSSPQQSQSFVKVTALAHASSFFGSVSLCSPSLTIPFHGTTSTSAVPSNRSSCSSRGTPISHLHPHLLFHLHLSHGLQLQMKTHHQLKAAWPLWMSTCRRNLWKMSTLPQLLWMSTHSLDSHSQDGE